MHINGTNNLWRCCKTPDSYFFSKYVIPWGWASWRRAWKLLEADCHSWQESSVQSNIQNYLHSSAESEHWSTIFSSIKKHPDKLTGYDYAWQFTCLKYNGLAITPTSNLITNIGFGSGATHTQQINYSHIIPAKALKFPLSHPTEVKANPEIDEWIFRVHALYEEARPWHRRLNQYRIQLGALRQRLFKYSISRPHDNAPI
ncbi:MAG: hypothetical protein B7X06_00990 [Verrucomicrobia bacterium 21-51-4]|nr:MAG: hypothetical protein B7X06_00990 [Verrucomicrobia bacterium 21-51-4]